LRSSEVLRKQDSSTIDNERYMSELNSNEQIVAKQGQRLRHLDYVQNEIAAFPHDEISEFG